MKVEERIAALEGRMDALERWTGVTAHPASIPAPARRSTAPPPSPPAVDRATARPASPPAADRDRVAFEDALGGRVLAWVGGVAVALGLCFLLAIAVSRGWLGEVERTALAGVVSLVLVTVGVRAHGRTDASLAAAAAGIAGLFATCVVAGSVYELVPSLAALIGALAVGAVATALAVIWEARGIAALGILGALLSPALVGASTSGSAVVLLLVATAAAAGVLLWQRWSWLATGMYAAATPQWVAYLVLENPSAPAALAVLVGFGALTVAAAVGFEVRSSTPTLRIGSIVLVGLNALVLAGIGAAVLDSAVADGWLVALAVAHIAAGFATRRVSDELGLTAMTLGVVLADVAAARLLDGLPLIVGWAAAGLVFAALVRGASARLERPVLVAGLGGHLLLALTHAMMAAPPETLSGGPDGFLGLVGLAVVAAATTVSGRLAADGYPELRAVLDVSALAVLAYQTAIALDGVALTIALAGEAAALALVARRRPDDEIAIAATVAFAAAAPLHALAVLAPPAALLSGLEAPGAAALGLAAAAVGVAAIGFAAPQWAVAARAAAAVIVLYALSVELVTPFQPGPEAAGLPLASIDVRQQGQALLSALWAIVGVAVLVAGLVRDDALLRRGALILLAVTVGKVFVLDLASLTSVYRATSFVALGLLLLLGAFAWQRIRPRPLPDLRTMPGPLR